MSEQRWIIHDGRVQKFDPTVSVAPGRTVGQVPELHLVDVRPDDEIYESELEACMVAALAHARNSELSRVACSEMLKRFNELLGSRRDSTWKMNRSWEGA